MPICPDANVCSMSRIVCIAGRVLQNMLHFESLFIVLGLCVDMVTSCLLDCLCTCLGATSDGAYTNNDNSVKT